MSLKTVKNKIIKICKKNFFFADFINLRSDKIPKIRMINEKNMKEKIPSLKKRYPKKIKIPPVKGTDDFEENF